MQPPYQHLGWVDFVGEPGCHRLIRERWQKKMFQPTEGVFGRRQMLVASTRLALGYPSASGYMPRLSRQYRQIDARAVTWWGHQTVLAPSASPGRGCMRGFAVGDPWRAKKRRPQGRHGVKNSDSGTFQALRRNRLRLSPTSPRASRPRVAGSGTSCEQHWEKVVMLIMHRAHLSTMPRCPASCWRDSLMKIDDEHLPLRP
jgi:hypothetical protein